MVLTTSLGEPMLDGLPICVPKIMLPRQELSLSKWSCVACDQFESEPQYWAEMDAFVGDAPSSLRVIFPEVFLASVSGGTPADDKQRIEEIRRVMHRYIEQQIFVERPPAFIAIDRRTAHVPSRKGLVLAIDLEEYNFDCPLPTLIRPTEKTIVARLPPRIAIRERAPLELPHIIMIIDDPGKSVIEPLFENQGLAEPEYQVELFKGAGAVKGLRVTTEGTKHVERSMKALTARETAAASAQGRRPAVIFIGDGNHSLATAKSCWEALKCNGHVGMDHPQRFALVELQNLHDDGVVFEPIHRVLFGANPDALKAFLEVAWGCTAIPFAEPIPSQAIVLVRRDEKLILEPPVDKLPVVSMSIAVDAFVQENPGVSIGYVHGEEPVISACADGKATGLILPALDKSRFIPTIHDIGTLPRKSFSMGEATEKRFYIEARNILPFDVAEKRKKIIDQFSKLDNTQSKHIPTKVVRKILALVLPNVSSDDIDILIKNSEASCGDVVEYEQLVHFLMR